MSSHTDEFVRQTDSQDNSFPLTMVCVSLLYYETLISVKMYCLIVMYCELSCGAIPVMQVIGRITFSID